MTNTTEKKQIETKIPGKRHDILKAAKQVTCSPKEGKDLIAEGWAAADLHVHTWCSYDVIPVPYNDPLFLYEKAIHAGMKFITFTDHDTMDAYDQIGWTRERIVPGVEIKILDRQRVGHTVHMNVYQLDRKIFQELEDIAEKCGNIELLIDCIKSHQLPYIYNHPLWHEPYEKLNISAVFDLMSLFQVLEYNMGRVNHLNQIAAYMARSAGKGLVAVTDTHSGRIAEAYTLARGNSFAGFMAEIQAGRSLLVSQDLTLARLTSEVLDRLNCMFSQEHWQFAKPGYSLETGIGILDDHIQKIILAPARENNMLKNTLKWLMTGVALSKIPHSLYIRSQNLLAYSVLQGMPA
ncbi:MAG: PHP domain-containing protein [Candidatus Aminicenantes bacterium]|nr:PHP domain-containing protein [Candidatus Aminicenantes bacterium]